MNEKKSEKLKCRKILRMIDSRIEDLQILKGGLLMSNKAFRTILDEHPELKAEFETLRARKFKIERKLWKQ